MEKGIKVRSGSKCKTASSRSVSYKEILCNCCEAKSIVGRVDKTGTQGLKSHPMKLTWVRYSTPALIILTCCCISIPIAASAAATPFSFPDWVELSPKISPPARSYLAMTYDPISGKVIAFGGFDGTNYLND